MSDKGSMLMYIIITISIIYTIVVTTKKIRLTSRRRKFLKKYKKKIKEINTAIENNSSVDILGEYMIVKKNSTEKSSKNIFYDSNVKEDVGQNINNISDEIVIKNVIKNEEDVPIIGIFKDRYGNIYLNGKKIDCVNEYK